MVYEQISDETKLKNYMAIAPKTFRKFGAKFLTRGYPAVIKENGKNERTIIVEFPSVAKAEEFYDSPEYVVALDALAGGAIRSFKICEAYEWNLNQILILNLAEIQWKNTAKQNRQC